MSKFNLGDRFKIKIGTGIEGTIKAVADDSVYVELDQYVKAENDGEELNVREGWISMADAEELFEIIEPSDWASIWDKGST